MYKIKSVSKNEELKNTIPNCSSKIKIKSKKLFEKYSKTKKNLKTHEF